MSRLRMLLPLLTLALAACSASVPLDDAYEACNPGDDCAHGTVCARSSLLPQFYAGYLCTNGCNVAQDCLQDLQESVLCANSQCYFQCPLDGSACPNGTGCVSFQDEEGFEVDLCQP